MQHSITIGRLLCSISLATVAQINMAAEAPHYEDGFLTIPAVSTSSGVGNLQEIVIKQEADGEISLVDFKEGVTNKSIEVVTHSLTSSFPYQAFIQFSGTFTNGCPDIGQTSIRRIDQEFEITTYLKNTAWLLDPTAYACGAVIQEFSAIVPLDIYGLPAGEYTYTLNGEFSGSFTLTTNNILDEFE